MKLNKIHHIAIICSDYQKSKSFYIEILGANIINETYRIERNSYKLDLSIANSQIELFSFPVTPPRVDNPEASGLRHLAFEVDSVENTVNELKSRGVKVETINTDNLTNKKFTFFKDPDGLPIEIYEK